MKKKAKPDISYVISVYDDYAGIWPTIMDLRIRNDMTNIELIVIDNLPSSPDSKELIRLVQRTHESSWGAKYIAFSDAVGTSPPRDLAMRLATADVILQTDSHVQLYNPSNVSVNDSIPRVLQYYKEHPDSLDLLTGPLFFDELNNSVATHFNAVWRNEMWGTWGCAWAPPCSEGELFSVIESDNHMAQFISMDLDWRILSGSAQCSIKYPDIPFAQHEKVLKDLGCRQLGLHADDEFEIPGHGLGLFSCRKEAWLGFNPEARGFGGEELYIHEKFRRAGRRCLSLGFLGWVHRFHRPGGVKYPLRRWDKIRNYVLEFNEIQRPLASIYDHFVGEKRMPQIEWEALVANPSAEMPPQKVLDKLSGKPQTLEELYDWVIKHPRDLEKHFPMLRKAASMCDRVTEFSKRGETAVALAAGQPKTFTSYNTEAGGDLVKTLATVTHYNPISLASHEVPEIEETDMLFIHSEHSASKLNEELDKFASKVKRFIALTCTHNYGQKGEDGAAGLHAAMAKFLKRNPEWFIAGHDAQQCGLTIFGCLATDRPVTVDGKILTINIIPPENGPGKQMKLMLEQLGITPSVSCDCNGKANQMDFWGVEGCRNRLRGRPYPQEEMLDEEGLVGWMKKGMDKWDWTEKLQKALDEGRDITWLDKSAAIAEIVKRAVKSDFKFKINPLDMWGSILTEAINRAELIEQEEDRQEKAEQARKAGHAN